MPFGIGDDLALRDEAAVLRGEVSNSIVGRRPEGEVGKELADSDPVTGRCARLARIVHACSNSQIEGIEDRPPSLPFVDLKLELIEFEVKGVKGFGEHRIERKREGCDEIGTDDHHERPHDPVIATYLRAHNGHRSPQGSLSHADLPLDRRASVLWGA